MATKPRIHVGAHASPELSAIMKAVAADPTRARPPPRDE